MEPADFYAYQPSHLKERLSKNHSPLHSRNLAEATAISHQPSHAKKTMTTQKTPSTKPAKAPAKTVKAVKANKPAKSPKSAKSATSGSTPKPPKPSTATPDGSLVRLHDLIGVAVFYLPPQLRRIVGDALHQQNLEDLSATEITLVVRTASDVIYVDLPVLIREMPTSKSADAAQ